MTIERIILASWRYACFMVCGSLILNCHLGTNQHNTTNNTVVTPTPPLLTLLSIRPSMGTMIGGTQVLLTGNGFNSNTQVQFDQSMATAIKVLSATNLTCLTPAHQVATIDVTAIDLSSKATSPALTYTYFNTSSLRYGFAATAGGGLSRAGGIRLTGAIGLPATAPVTSKVTGVLTFQPGIPNTLAIYE